MSSSASKRYGTCVFCGRSEDCEETCGTFFKKEGISVHYFCMLFSSALIQRGRTSRQGISGFMIRDIKKEAIRGNRLRCVFCKNTGATIGCAIPKCSKKFHMPCGLEKDSLHQYFGNYLSFCSEHRPQQQQAMPSDDRRTRQVETSTCPICLDSVEACPSNSTLQATCCNSAWMHRDCVQAQAKNAGYFFKCPLCNNKKKFQIQMLTLGIYVPEKDASWEQDLNAYGDLLFRHNRCDHEACQCPNGVDHDIEGSRWQIILCAVCGSQGCHVACGKLKFSKPKFECDQCKSILKSLHEKSKPPTPKALRSRRSLAHVEAAPNERQHDRSASYYAIRKRKLSLERIRQCLTKRLAGESTSRSVDADVASPVELGGSSSSEASDCGAPTQDSEDVFVDVEASESASVQSGSADEIEVCDNEDDDDRNLAAEYNSWRLSPTDFPSPAAPSTQSSVSSDDDSDVIGSSPIRVISPETTAVELVNVEDEVLPKLERSYTPPLPPTNTKLPLA